MKLQNIQYIGEKCVGKMAAPYDALLTNQFRSHINVTSLSFHYCNNNNLQEGVNKHKGNTHNDN